MILKIIHQLVLQFQVLLVNRVVSASSSQINDVDIVIIWVDGGDREWQKVKAKYSRTMLTDSNVDISSSRYRDWDNLQYLFRGIEKYAPWVRTVHFVTQGHVPHWLNLDNKKLNFVKHEDFIPKEYLPTFSSHPIELNLHRIKGLAEKFIYFNDDMFIIKPMCKNDFFKGSLPRDMAVMGYVPTSNNINDIFPHILLNNMSIINKHFDKRSVIRKYPLKWYSFRYNLKSNIKNMSMFGYKTFAEISSSHMPSPLLKSTFKTVWEKEPTLLEQTSFHKFRDIKDVNQYLMKTWQIASGKFYPKDIYRISQGFGDVENQIDKIKDVIQNHKASLICINDTEYINNFDETKQIITGSFEAILPDKSSFEL